MTTVRVPASSANLGPGFDALGMALEIYLICRFEAADRLTIRATGRDAECISSLEDNLIWQTVLAVARDTGGTLPPVTRSEEHTSELQSPCNLVCRLLLEKKDE